PVLAPLPDVAVHVVQAPDVRRETPRRRRLLAAHAGAVAAVGVGAVVVGQVGAEDLAAGERRGGAGAAGVLPLSLRRQAVELPLALAQLHQERLAVVPRHLLDGAGVAPEAARVVA